MNKKDKYISLSNHKDLDNPKDKTLYRFLEFIPALFSWGTLIGSFLLSWIAPAPIAILIIIFDLYWVLKIIYLSIHQITSFKKMEKNKKENWIKKVKKIKNWEKVHHLIILPTYKESEEIITSSCQAIYETKYPKEKITIILTTEKRAGEKYLKIAQKIKNKFKNKFFKFVTTTHPDDIEGEVIGKGSNIAWGLKKAKEKVIK